MDEISNDSAHRAMHVVILSAHETGDFGSVEQKIVSAGFEAAEAAALAKAIEALLKKQVDIDQFAQLVVQAGVSHERMQFVMFGVCRGLADIGFQNES